MTTLCLTWWMMTTPTAYCVWGFLSICMQYTIDDWATSATNNTSSTKMTKYVHTYSSLELHFSHFFSKLQNLKMKTLQIFWCSFKFPDGLKGKNCWIIFFSLFCKCVLKQKTIWIFSAYQESEGGRNFDFASWNLLAVFATV